MLLCFGDCDNVCGGVVAMTSVLFRSIQDWTEFS